MALELVNKLPYDHPYRWDGTEVGGQKLWRPDELGADLALWLDAEDTDNITLNGSTVSQWGDKSGNARHASQASASNQPTYTASAYAGKPTLTFDGVNDNLEVNYNYSGDKATIYAVVSRLGGGSTEQWVFSSYGGTNGTPLVAPMWATGAGTDEWATYSTTFLSNGAELPTDGTPFALGLVSDISGSVLDAFTNGTRSAQHATGARYTGGGARNFIGAEVDGNSRFLSGRISEIIQTETVLSTTDRQKLEGYLAWKWGLEANLPGTHPYRYTPPTTGEPAWDADALDYIGRVQDEDGQGLELSVRIAINDFVVGCKADGIWDAIKASCILAGARTLAGALVPLKGAAPTNFNFVSGDYNRNTGLVGNGSTKYLDSNRNNNEQLQDSSHLSVYTTTFQTRNTTRTVIGNVGSGGGSQLMTIGLDRIYFRINWSAPGFLTDATTNTGFWGGSRSVSASTTGRYGGTNYTLTDNSAVPSNSPNLLFARNPDNPSNFSDARLAFYSIGESLDLALLDARVTTLINAYGAI